MQATQFLEYQGFDFFARCCVDSVLHERGDKSSFVFGALPGCALNG